MADFRAVTVGPLSLVSLRRPLTLALLVFNVGVEIGQLLFIAAVLTLAALASRLLRDHLDPRWTVVAPAYLIGSIASYRVVERTAAFFSS